MLDDVYTEAEINMDSAIDYLKRELAKIRTGRATPALLDSVRVDYYGALTPLNQVASVSAPEPRLLVVQPWEKRLIADIEKAILNANLGLNPSNDGNLVRVPIPELSDERRRDMLKTVKDRCEETRVSIRSSRHKANDAAKKLEKDKEISEDNLKDGLDKIQKITNEHIKKVDDLLKNKEKELLED